jgi:hypothetical protein
MKGQATTTKRVFHVNNYFEPDILAPFQYSNTNHRRDHFYPEEKLMFAVLTDAIECFQKYMSAKSRGCRKLFEEAEAWIISRDDQAPFSFEHVCEVLRLSPSYLRVGLMRWCADKTSPTCQHKRIREPLRYQYRLRNTRIIA